MSYDNYKQHNYHKEQFKPESDFEHFDFLKDYYKDHAYSPYNNYPLRNPCSTCADQPTCERIETFNNDGCSYHSGVQHRKKIQVTYKHKLPTDIKYLTRVRYTGISRVEL